MTALLDTSESLDVCAAEIGDGVEVGQLLTPGTSFRRRSDVFAIDNKAYTGLDVDRFESLLRREWEARDLCKFVAVPDVPFSARRTMEVYRHWAPKLRADGWKLALVAQNGHEDIDIPWAEIRKGAIFIGGDDAFKDGPHGAAIIKAAIAMGVWVHVGRVNGVKRVAYLRDLFGGYDRWSFDGSGISQYTEMREKIGRVLRDAKEEIELLFKQAV